MGNVEDFRREADQIREVMDAKMGTVWSAIEGIRHILERMNVAVEKQTEQNTQLALIGNTLHHFQEVYVENREKVDSRLTDHDARLKSLETKLTLKEWTNKGFWTLAVTALTGAAAFATANFDKIAALFGM